MLKWIRDWKRRRNGWENYHDTDKGIARWRRVYMDFPASTRISPCGDDGILVCHIHAHTAYEVIDD